MPLTDLKIRKAKQKDKAYRLTGALGLSLLVRPTGTKSWQFRYQYLGREKILSIGQYPIISLADARTRRDDAKRLIADGKDPSVEKQLSQIDAETKARMTFKEVADEYYDNLVDRGLAATTLRKKRWHIEDLAKSLHSYIAKHMGGLKQFLDDGTVEMDSNIPSHRYFVSAAGQRSSAQSVLLP